MSERGDAKSCRWPTAARFLPILLTALAVTGCGPRSSEPVAAPSDARAPVADVGASGETGAPDTGATPPGDVNAPAAATAAGPRQSPAAGSQTTSAPGARPAISPSATPSAASSATGQPQKSQPQKAPDGRATSTPTGPAGVAPEPGATLTPGQGSPVVVASVGTYSGPAASTIKPLLEGVQLWVKHINQAGGLNGHSVSLIVYDDAGDPARHRSQIQEAVERRKVVAFLGNGDALTGQGSVKYLEEKRIPHIGTMGGITWAHSTPMYFPQASEADAFYVSIITGVAEQVVPKGKKKLGTLMCAEAQGCQDADRVYARIAKDLGFEHVYRGTASIAQPDYTAECLAARNAGAEVLLTFLDGNSITRLGSSCRRQSYQAVIATGSVIALDRFKDDPNLDGMVAAHHTVPWFQSGTPATDEFQNAMRTLGAGLASGAGTTAGWTAGKLFERAGAHLPEPPTAEAVLAGLWSMHDDTLGGITRPLTFIENKPAPERACWFDMQVKDKAWVSPDGFALHCA